MNVLQSLVLGVVQGLTEFIPVSSTAHLILAPELLPIARPRPAIAHTYDTIIQIGTVIPVILYFWRDWVKLLAALLRVMKQGWAANDPEERLAKGVIIGSIPAGVLGLLLEKKIEMFAEPGKFHQAFLLIGCTLIGVGILMWWVDATSRKSRDLENVRLPDAVFVGIAQALALIPGVSRSGSTITAGLFAGLTREAAARFSFLLMTPIMLAATGYKFLKLLTGHQQATSGEWASMALATAVSAVVGYFAIHFLLGWLRTRSVAFFAMWRILVGAFSIGLHFSIGHGGGAAVTPPAGPPVVVPNAPSIGSIRLPHVTADRWRRSDLPS